MRCSSPLRQLDVAAQSGDQHPLLGPLISPHAVRGPSRLLYKLLWRKMSPLQHSHIKEVANPLLVRAEIVMVMIEFVTQRSVFAFLMIVSAIKVL